MKAWNELIIKVHDIETLFEEFSITISDPGFKNPLDLRINRFTNQIDSICKALQDISVNYWCGYNNVQFDAQVCQFVLDNQERWVDKTGAEICALIWQFATDVIDLTNNGLFPPYREKYLWAKQMDLFKIHHFDNDARSTSLKWCEYTMDMEDIEEMPLPHVEWEWIGNHRVPKDRLWGPKEFEMTDHYRRNDVKATCKLLDYTLGNVENEVYKGKNKIQDRIDIITEFNLPPEAMNYSDVKIGDELNKLGYMKLKKIQNERVLYDLKKNRKARKGFTYRDCIPNYINFTTPAFRDLLERIGPVKVELRDKKDKDGKKRSQFFKFTFNGTIYTLARGGLHSNEKNRTLIPSESEHLMDADIGSQYPCAIFKRKLFPSHLGPEWLTMYGSTIVRRISYKARGKTDKRAKGVAEMLKLSLNGGGFGKLNEPTNWQYDPFAAFSCTIGNQFEILMLIEALEVEGGIHVVSANTDGIVCLFDKNKLDKYYEICHAWEKKVQMPIVEGQLLGALEFTEYSKMVQKSVNDYIAMPIEGKVKKKGDFMTEFELNKNPSRRILPLIYEQYFTKGVSPEDYLKSYEDISDFCIGLKASRNYHYEATDSSGKDITKYNRVVRYYVSNEGKLLIKVKNEGSEATGPQISNCEARDQSYWRTTECNNYGSATFKERGVCEKYYLEAAHEFIDSIERGQKKGKKSIHNPNQQTLW